MDERAEQMVSRFTRGVTPDQAAAFAAENGYTITRMIGHPAETHRGPLDGYQAHAVCRGGGRMLRRMEHAAGQMAPWLLHLSVEGGGYAVWAMSQPSEDDRPINPLGIAAALALGATILVLLAWAGHRAGFWGWPW